MDLARRRLWVWDVGTNSSLHAITLKKIRSNVPVVCYKLSLTSFDINLYALPIRRG